MLAQLRASWMNKWPNEVLQYSCLHWNCRTLVYNNDCSILNFLVSKISKPNFIYSYPISQTHHHFPYPNLNPDLSPTPTPTPVKPNRLPPYIFLILFYSNSSRPFHARVLYLHLILVNFIHVHISKNSVCIILVNIMH